MVPQHLNRLFILPDEYLMEHKSIKMSLSLLQTIFSIENNFTTNIEHDESIMSDRKKMPIFSTINKMIDNNKEIEINVDVAILLHSALKKIPQIPFQYVMDVWRWKLFNQSESMNNANDLFWKLAFVEQGIHSPDFVNRHQYFDPGAKFHVVDNIPFSQ